MQSILRWARQKHSRQVSFSLFFPLFLSFSRLFYYRFIIISGRVVVVSFLSFFFYSKRYVVFITQAYAQKSTRGTLGLLVPFEVGVRGGGYRTPRSLVRGTAGEHARSRLIPEGESSFAVRLTRRQLYSFLAS